MQNGSTLRVVGLVFYILFLLKIMPDFWKLSDSSIYIMFDILVKVKVKFTLEQALKAQRGNRGIPLLFL